MEKQFMEKFRTELYIFLGVALLVIAIKCLPARKAEVFKLAPIKVTSEAIYQDYRNNKEADGKYLGKLVEVSGVVKLIGQTTKDEPFLVLSGSDAYGDVRCIFSNPDWKPGEVKLEQKVTIQGACLGRAVNVYIDECSVRS